MLSISTRSGNARTSVNNVEQTVVDLKKSDLGNAQELVELTEGGKPLESFSATHVHGPNCNHGSPVRDLGALAKPLHHDMLPDEFEGALDAYYSSTSKKKYFPIYADVFPKLKASQVGAQTTIELTEGVVLNGTVKSLKAYPSDPSAFSGMVDLADYDAKLSFFGSADGVKAQILFNEKSTALVFEESADGPTFVETQISDLFCSGQGTVYPLNHPSNAGSGYLSKE